MIIPNPPQIVIRRLPLRSTRERPADRGEFIIMRGEVQRYQEAGGGRRGRDLQKLRSGKVERSLAHLYETSAMRRMHLRRNDNILKRLHPAQPQRTRSAAERMFTLQRPKLPPSLYKCLATTIGIETPQSGVACRAANLTRWRDREMVERWVASAWLLKEKNLRENDGHRDLWALATILGRQTSGSAIAGEVA